MSNLLISLTNKILGTRGAVEALVTKRKPAQLGVLASWQLRSRVDPQATRGLVKNIPAAAVPIVEKKTVGGVGQPLPTVVPVVVDGVGQEQLARCHHRVIQQGVPCALVWCVFCVRLASLKIFKG